MTRLSREIGFYLAAANDARVTLYCLLLRFHAPLIESAVVRSGKKHRARRPLIRRSGRRKSGALGPCYLFVRPGCVVAIWDRSIVTDSSPKQRLNVGLIQRAPAFRGDVTNL